MATSQKDSFLDLERHRLRLEENVAKLRQSLRHWQTWEAEYEGLKEEIGNSKTTQSAETMLAIGRDYGGDLVNEKEMRELVGLDKGLQRSAKQVVDLLSRRIDYVQQNLRSVQKQLDSAEERLHNVMVVSRPEVRTEEGLPVTDIQEELDEEGNIISSTARRPGDTRPQLVEALRKAGVPDDILKVTAVNPIEEELSPKVSEYTALDPFEEDMSPKITEFRAAPPRDRLGIVTADGAAKSNRGVSHSKMQRKSVSFMDTSKESKPATRFTPASQPYVGAEVDRLGPDSGVAQSDAEIGGLLEAEDALHSPHLSNEESAEDAALRREMLQYGLNEVGAVVAELELEENSSDFGSGDDSLDGEEVEDASSNEEDDKFGRTTRRVVSDTYSKEMLELQQRLDARMIENVGPNPGEASLAHYTNDIRRLVVREENVKPDMSQEPIKKAVRKEVRFADDPRVRAKSKMTGDTKKLEVRDRRNLSQPAVQEVVQERLLSKASSEAKSTSKTREVSSFKRSRAADADDRTGADAMSFTSPVSASKKTHLDMKNLPIRPIAAGKLPSRKTADLQVTSTSESSSEAVGSRTAPEGPPGQIMSGSIIERDVSPAAIAPPDSDDLDAAILYQQVTAEYHRRRNAMIQKQGGFMPTEEEAEDPLYEEVNGKIRQVSRFKAAKLRGQGIL